MKIRNAVSLGQNVTLVYDRLELGGVDITKLKGFVGADPGPTVWDTPEVKLVVYPPSAAMLRIAERHVSVTLSQQGSDVAQEPMMDVTVKAHEHVTDLGSKLVAYGFNYDIGFTVSEGDMASLTRRCFLRDDAGVERALRGELLAFAPKLVFGRDAAVHTLTLDPVGSERLKVALNVHFEGGEIQLPDSPSLTQAFRTEYDRMVQDVHALLEQEPKV